MNDEIKTDCIFLNTPACSLLNAKNCRSCPVFPLKGEELKAADEDMRILCGMLPENGAEELINAGECLLCKGKTGNEPAGFAQISLGHIHPLMPDAKKDRRKARAFRRHGRDTGLVVPVQLPVCAHCRRKFTLENNLPLFIGALIALVGLTVVSRESIRRTLAAISHSAPFLIFAAFVLFGMGTAMLVRYFIGLNIEKNIKTHAFEIAGVREMVKNGWFPLPAGKDGLSFGFTKKRLKNGIPTGDNQAALIAAVLAGNKKTEPHGDSEYVTGENIPADNTDIERKEENENINENINESINESINGNIYGNINEDMNHGINGNGA